MLPKFGTHICAEVLTTFDDIFIFQKVPPEPVQNLECYSTNILDYWCEWDDGLFTNLKVQDTMYYEG